MRSNQDGLLFLRELGLWEPLRASFQEPQAKEAVGDVPSKFPEPGETGIVYRATREFRRAELQFEGCAID